jgi:hypothetical protein
VPPINSKDQEDEEIRGEDEGFEGSHRRWGLRP